MMFHRAWQGTVGVLFGVSGSVFAVLSAMVVATGWTDSTRSAGFIALAVAGVSGFVWTIFESVERRRRREEKARD